MFRQGMEFSMQVTEATTLAGLRRHRGKVVFVYLYEYSVQQLSLLQPDTPCLNIVISTSDLRLGKYGSEFSTRFAHQGISRKSKATTNADRRQCQLANGLSMPRIHLGVYLTSGKETSNAVRWALEGGSWPIRHVRLLILAFQAGYRAYVGLAALEHNTNQEH